MPEPREQLELVGAAHLFRLLAQPAVKQVPAGVEEAEGAEVLGWRPALVPAPQAQRQRAWWRWRGERRGRLTQAWR